MKRRLKIGAVLSNLTTKEPQPPLQRFGSVSPLVFMQLKEDRHVYIVITGNYLKLSNL